MIKLVSSGIVFSTLLIAAITYQSAGRYAAFSALLGGSLMLFNLLGLWAVWKFIFTKKSIALALLAIIFKYLILGIALWSLTRAPWLHNAAFAAGLGTLVFGVLFALLLQKRTD